MRNPLRRTPIQRTPAAFAAADRGRLHAVLEELEQAKNYSAWVLQMIAPHISGRILEVGAGRGTYSTYFAEHGHLTALEPSEVNSVALRERLKDYPNASVITAELAGTAAPGSYDTVVLLNVLEHIADDRQALGDIYAALAPGGKMVLWVPAFESLYGKFDHEIGHYRRYRHNQLLALVHKVGFQKVSAKYTNMLGFFAWWLVVRVLGRAPTSGRLALIYDRYFIPVISRVERFVRPPIGQSLLVIAQRS
ncbi:MAG: class I SAM-dependent methyltransferase [Ilumatobacteraceae bacterium]|nr:class I SAM-dependent methyltransferase [Ilumatobacteraceae bacterium]